MQKAPPVADIGAIKAQVASLYHQLDALGEVAAVKQSAGAFRWHPDEKNRLSLFPVLHEDLWKIREKLQGLHWQAPEVDFTKDKADWLRMDKDQQRFVVMQLAFFSRIDIDALDYIDGLSDEIDCMEARMVFAAQRDQECTHAESYALQIGAVLDGKEKTRVLEAARTMPIIGKIRAWVVQWFDRARPLGERLVAFAGVEGFLFQGSFCCLQWLREKNRLPGITQSNSYIMRDEGVHTSNTTLLVRKYLIARPSQERAEEIFQSLMAIVDEFVKESLPVSLIGMNAELMMQYVQSQADFVLRSMAYAPVWKAVSPFRFMDKLALNEVSKTSFFELRPTEYQNVTNSEAVQFRLDNTKNELEDTD